jgi:hypothetical protein
MQAFTKQLLELWYELIGGDHHKDRDCHFYIEKNFSTYKKPQWRLYQNGYWINYYEKYFPTYDEAEKGLQDLLIEKIRFFTENVENENDKELVVRNKLQKLLEGNDSPADEPSISERR